MPYELWARRTYTIRRYAVVDGDTVIAQVAEERPPRQWHRLRLHGIDAPETEQPWGPEATELLGKLMALNGQVYAYITQEQDVYGRPVVILHTGDGRPPFNARLVEAGMAYVAYGGDYRQEQRGARQARVGVWQQLGGGERPWDYRRKQPRRQPHITWRMPRRRRRAGCLSVLAVPLAILLVIILASLIAALA